MQSRQITCSKKKGCLEQQVKQNSASTEFEGTENKLLVPFFNFFFYLSIVPFRIQLDLDGNRYELQTVKIHQILCGFLHLVVIFVTGYAVCRGALFLFDDEMSIVAVFEFLSNGGTFLSAVLLFHTFWWRRTLLLNMIECTRTVQSGGKRRREITVYMILSVIITFMGATSWLMIHDESHYMSMPQLMKNSTLLEFYADIDENNVTTTQISGVALYIALHALLVPCVAFHAFFEGLLFIVILALRQIVNEFRIKLLNLQNNPREGVELYQKLKKGFASIQEAYGSFLAVYFVTAVAYFAETPHIFMGKRGEAEKIFLIYVVLIGFIWGVGSEFHHCVRSTLLKWIQDQTYNQILDTKSRLTLLALSIEISSDPVALSCKYFSLTYGHLVSTLTVVVTYGIIVIQLN